MRLINADALSKDLEKRWNVNDDQDFCNKEVWHALEEAPTINAVEVVRCKDCIVSETFQRDSNGTTERYCKAFTHLRMVADDDYCSYGERREP